MVKITDQIPICYAVDDKYVNPALVSITSLLSNSSISDSFRFYILDGGISSSNKNKFLKLVKMKYFRLDFISVNNNDFRHFPLHNKNHFTVVNYYRLKIPQFIPQENKILYLDSDTIVLKSLSPLFNINIDNYHIGACKTQTSDQNCRRLGLDITHSYFNSGVLLINAYKWRTTNIESKFYDFINSSTPEMLLNVDQDVLNAVLYDQTFFIHQKWNVEIRTDLIPSHAYKRLLLNPCIIHYVSIDKPWNANTLHDTTLYNKYLEIFNSL